VGLQAEIRTAVGKKKGTTSSIKYCGRERETKGSKDERNNQIARNPKRTWKTTEGRGGENEFSFPAKKRKKVGGRKSLGG